MRQWSEEEYQQIQFGREEKEERVRDREWERNIENGGEGKKEIEIKTEKHRQIKDGWFDLIVIFHEIEDWKPSYKSNRTWWNRKVKVRLASPKKLVGFEG